MIKQWIIKKVDEETRQVIKDQARKNSCTIPELLKIVFTNAEPEAQQGDKSWTIHNLSPHDIAYIKRGAKGAKMTIGEFIHNAIIQGNEARETKDKAIEIVERLSKELINQLYGSE